MISSKTNYLSHTWIKKCTLAKIVKKQIVDRFYGGYINNPLMTLAKN